MQTSKTGFTLIELLVVVLIIGILAAVALPQYQLAVSKSKINSQLPLLRAIKDAQEIYRMSNGVYNDDLRALDITIPCTLVGFAPQNFLCGKDFYLSNNTAGDTLSLFYCPGKADSVSQCAQNSQIQISFYMDYANVSDDKKGKQVCYVVRGKNQALCTLFQHM